MSVSCFIVVTYIRRRAYGTLCIRDWIESHDLVGGKFLSYIHILWGPRNPYGLTQCTNMPGGSLRPLKLQMKILKLQTIVTPMVSVEVWPLPEFMCCDFLRSKLIVYGILYTKLKRSIWSRSPVQVYKRACVLCRFSPWIRIWKFLYYAKAMGIVSTVLGRRSDDPTICLGSRYVFQ